MRILVMYGLFEPSERHLEKLRELGAEVVIAHSEAEAISAASTAEIILGHRYLRQTLPHAPRLRWVQTTAGGVDRLPTRELARRGITLTRVTFTAGPIARHAVTLAWALQRRIPEACRRQATREWNPVFDWLPQPRRALVFGTGVIGAGIARILKSDGLTVTGVKRDPNTRPAACFDTFVTLADARPLLAQTDWCFNALPNTRETEGWFNEATLQMLPRHALFINVGRGSAVVTADLCRTLSSGHLGGAAIDVIEPSSPDASDPIWQTPRLLITPHVAAHYAERPQDMEALSETQVARYVSGEPLQDIVDLREVAVSR